MLTAPASGAPSPSSVILGLPGSDCPRSVGGYWSSSPRIDWWPSALCRNDGSWTNANMIEVLGLTLCHFQLCHVALIQPQDRLTVRTYLVALEGPSRQNAVMLTESTDRHTRCPWLGDPQHVGPAIVTFQTQAHPHSMCVSVLLFWLKSSIIVWIGLHTLLCT
nr:hypothetical protein CFP56_72397 [Quercus suber]